VKTENRICLYDNMKFILILLVVVGHFAEPFILKSNFFKSIFFYIYTFHMPLFVFISGHFHRNNKIVQKVLSYIAIGFASKMIIALCSVFINGNSWQFKLLSDNGLPWYMFVLAIHILLSYILKDIDKKFILIIFVLLACFVGYDSTVSDYLYLSRTIIFYPFYVLGELVSEEQILRFNDSKGFKIVSTIVLVACLVICFMHIDKLFALCALFTGRNPFSVNALYTDWGCLYRLLCYTITFVMGSSILCLVPNHRLPIITSLGQKTLQVYFWHFPIMYLLLRFKVGDLLFPSKIGKLCWLACAVLITFILCLKPFGFPVVNIIKATHRPAQKG